LQKLARARGGECLSKEYVNSQTDLRWICEKNHRWRATPTNIKSGQWCPICSRIKRASALLEEMQNIAKANDGECLSNKYVSSQRELRWRCKEGQKVYWERISGFKWLLWC